MPLQALHLWLPPLFKAEDILQTPVKKRKRIILNEDSETGTNVVESKFREALMHRKLVTVHRKGKQLWFQMEGSDVAILFHFGMTGSFVIENETAPSYKSFKIKNEKWPPKFSKLEISFSNGTKLAFCDPRRLGRIRLRSNPLQCSPIKDLGIGHKSFSLFQATISDLTLIFTDPVIDGVPPVQDLLEKFRPINCPIKSLLLDQNKVFCGIGNWLADEILYQAGIHPDTVVSRLNEKGVESLRTSMQYVLQTAISLQAQSELFPKNWLFHYRWSKGKTKSTETVAEFGTQIFNFSIVYCNNPTINFCVRSSHCFRDCGRSNKRDCAERPKEEWRRVLSIRMRLQ